MTSDGSEWVWRSPVDPATVAVTGAGAAARRALRVRLDRQARDALPRCEQQTGSGRCRMHAWPGDRLCRRHAVARHMAAQRARRDAEKEAA